MNNNGSDALTPQEFEAASAFDAEFKSILETLGWDLPELETLLSDSRWRQIGLAAAKTLEAFT